MKKLTVNLRLVIISVLIIAAALAYINIYLPMRIELEKTVLKNFALLIKAYTNTEEADIELLMEGIESYVINETRVKQIQSGRVKHKWAEGLELINEGEYISYIDTSSKTDKCSYIRIKKNILFKPIRRISQISLVGFILGLSLLFIIMNITTIKNVQKYIKNLEQSKEKYKEYAIKDALTGTYSRLFFQNWLVDNAEGCNWVNSLSAIIMIDLDGYKDVNDTFGHLTGDEVLKKFADILKSSVREGDFIIRYGGDEFLILLRECDVAFCKNIISRIENKLNELKDFNIEISYGIEEIRDKSRLLDHIENADAKMYRMKRQKQKNL